LVSINLNLTKNNFFKFASILLIAIASNIYRITMLSDRIEKHQSAQNIMDPKIMQRSNLSISWTATKYKPFATKNSNIEIYEAWFPSPFGDVIAMGTEQGLIGLGFSNEIGQEVARQELAKKWPQKRFRVWPERMKNWVDSVFTGKGDIELHLVGTKFQIRVWEALMLIPPTEVTSYSSIANSINYPQAVRAVGTAIGQNPLGFIIPCHRVIQKSGGLGGYRWGCKLKRAILAYEGSHQDIK
jgi:AraC family transcriptional regulator of adaptative response/methylated-DNA-[protein]-cysteine methyltransferase